MDWLNQRQKELEMACELELEKRRAAEAQVNARCTSCPARIANGGRELELVQDAIRQTEERLQ